MNLRPSGYEPDELPGCSIPRLDGVRLAARGGNISVRATRAQAKSEKSARFRRALVDWPRGGAAFVEFARLVLGLQGTPGLRRPWVWGRLARRMNRWRSSLADPRVRWAIAALGLAGLVTVLAAWRAGVDLEFLSVLWKTCENFLRAYPWCLFAGLVVLPALPVPTSALLLLAGTVWRSQPAAACGISLLAMSLNMSWTYWVAARPGRGLVEKLLASSALRTQSTA